MDPLVWDGKRRSAVRFRQWAPVISLDSRLSIIKPVGDEWRRTDRVYAALQELGYVLHGACVIGHCIRQNFLVCQPLVSTGAVIQTSG